MIDNCGKSDLLVISHFDLMFNLDILSYIRNNFTADTGLIGTHKNGLIGIRRSAYKQFNTGLIGIGDLYTVPFPNAGKGVSRIYNANDPRCLPRESRIHGFDSLEMLELYMAAYGWKVIPLENEYMSFYRHFGTGACHPNFPHLHNLKTVTYNNPVRSGDIKNRMILLTNIMNQLGIKPI